MAQSHGHRQRLPARHPPGGKGGTTPWGQRTEGEWRARWVTWAGAAPPSTGSKLVTLGTEGEEHLRSRGRTISLEDPGWEEGPLAGSGLAEVLLAGKGAPGPAPKPHSAVCSAAGEGAWTSPHPAEGCSLREGPDACSRG